MVAFDADILIKLFGHRASASDKKKLAYLVKTLEETSERVLIPTPALAEYLALAGASASAMLDELRKHAVFYIAPFDQKAAVECALALDRDRSAGDKRGGAAGTWAKIKFDHQIVAIAKVNGVRQIYTEDGAVQRLAKRAGIPALGAADVQLPDSEKQVPLFDDNGDGKGA